MKKVIYTLAITTTLLSCSKTNPIDKQIKQYIDKKANGMIKLDTYKAAIKINDSTYKATYSFHNPLVDKQIKLTNIYYFNSKLDHIKNHETSKTFIKSEGEWVETSGF